MAWSSPRRARGAHAGPARQSSIRGLLDLRLGEPTGAWALGAALRDLLPRATTRTAPLALEPHAHRRGVAAVPHGRHLAGAARAVHGGVPEPYFPVAQGLDRRPGARDDALASLGVVRARLLWVGGAEYRIGKAPHGPPPERSHPAGLSLRIGRRGARSVDAPDPALRVAGCSAATRRRNVDAGRRAPVPPGLRPLHRRGLHERAVLQRSPG